MAKATPGDPRAGAAHTRGALPEIGGAFALEPRLRDLVEIRIAQLNGSVRALVRRAREALERGESRDRLSGLAAWRHSSAFSARERAALALAEALTLRPDTRAIAAARREAAAEFDEPELAELVVACAWSNARDRMELVGGAARTAPPLA